MWGHLSAEGAARILTFERDIPRPVEKGFAALITPARVADWMCADADIAPRVGGRFHLKFHNFDHRMEGEITRFEPPHTQSKSFLLLLFKKEDLSSFLRRDLTRPASRAP